MASERRGCWATWDKDESKWVGIVGDKPLMSAVTYYEDVRMVEFRDGERILTADELTLVQRVLHVAQVIARSYPDSELDHAVKKIPPSLLTAAKEAKP